MAASDCDYGKNLVKKNRFPTDILIFSFLITGRNENFLTFIIPSDNDKMIIRGRGLRILQKIVNFATRYEIRF